MTSRSKPSPESDREAQSCASARECLGAFLSGDLSRRARRELSVHLRACAPCSAELSALATAVASLRGGARRREEPWEGGLPLEGWDAPVSAGPRRPSAWRGLRPLVLPAAIVLLIAGVAPRAAHPARLTVLAGGIRVGAQERAAGSSPAAVGRGEWCATQEGARARVDWPSGSLELEPCTRIAVEDTALARARLESGAVLALGTCAVTCPLGIVEVREGEARIEAGEESLDVECRSGRVALLAASLERDLGPGERARLAVEPRAR